MHPTVRAALGKAIASIYYAKPTVFIPLITFVYGTNPAYARSPREAHQLWVRLRANDGAFRVFHDVVASTVLSLEMSDFKPEKMHDTVIAMMSSLSLPESGEMVDDEYRLRMGPGRDQEWIRAHPWFSVLVCWRYGLTLEESVSLGGLTSGSQGDGAGITEVLTKMAETKKSDEVA